MPALIDAALSDPRVTIGSIALAALSTAGLLVREWIRKAKHARNNASQEKVSEDEIEAARIAADAAIKVAEIEAAPTLIDKIEKLWAEKDECKETLGQEREARRKEREADAKACKQETARQVEAATAPLRAQLARVSEHAADTRESARGCEDTGVHELRAIAAEVRRPPTPPGGIPAQPSEDPGQPRRGELRQPAVEVPPPRGSKETR